MYSIKDYSYYALRKWDPIFWFGFLKILKLIISIVNKVTYFILGRSILKGSEEEIKLSKQYENSAHLVNVLGRGTISLIENHDESNFLYIHDSYQHPSYILKNDNIVLKGLNSRYAIFCVSEKSICTLDTSIGPFAYVNTFIAAEKLIFLPLEHFHRLAKETGSPFKKELRVVMIHMTARCGSTLLGMISITIIISIHPSISLYLVRKK